MRKEFIVRKYATANDYKELINFVMTTNKVIHVACTVAEDGYRIVTQEEKEKYKVPHTAKFLSVYNKWTPVYRIQMDKEFLHRCVYEVPVDFELKPKKSKWVTPTDEDVLRAGGRLKCEIRDKR